MDKRCEYTSGQRVRVLLSIKPHIIELSRPVMNVEAIFTGLPVDASPATRSLHSTFSWLKEFHKTCQANVGSVNIETLENLIIEFISLVAPEASNCRLKPIRSAKLKKCFIETIIYFHFLYQDVKESIDHTLYLDKMTNLLAMYMDAEIRASTCYKESLKKVSSRITTILVLALDNSQDHILEVLLKCQCILKQFDKICLLILRKVLADIQRMPRPELQYIRLLLTFKLWKTVASDVEERRRINKLASDRLLFPRTLLDNPQSLADILPCVPKKKQNNATHFLMLSKFKVKDAIQAFLTFTRERPHIFSEVENLCFPFETSSYFEFITGENIPLLNAIWSSMSIESIGEIAIIDEVPHSSRSVPPTISATTSSSVVGTAPESQVRVGESRKRVNTEVNNRGHLQKKRKDDSPNNATEASQNEICNERKPMDITPDESTQKIPTQCHDISSDTIPRSSLPVSHTVQNKDLPEFSCMQSEEKLEQIKNKDLPESSWMQGEEKLDQIQNKDLPETTCMQSEEKLDQIQNKDLPESTCIQSEEKLDQIQNNDLPETTCIQSEEKLEQFPNKDLLESSCMQSEENLDIIQNKDIPESTCIQSVVKFTQLQNKDLSEIIGIQSKVLLAQLENKDLPASSCMQSEEKVARLQIKDLPESTSMESKENLSQLEIKDLPESTCVQNEEELEQVQIKDLSESSYIQRGEKFSHTVTEQRSLSSNFKTKLTQSKPTHDPRCTIATDEFVCSSTMKTNIPLVVTADEPISVEVPLPSPVESDICSSLMKSSGADCVTSSTILKQKGDQESPSETDMQSESTDGEDRIDLSEYGFIQIPLNLYNYHSQDKSSTETSADYFTVDTSYDRLLISHKRDYNIPYYEFDGQITIDDKDLNQEIFTDCKDIENVAIPLLASLEGEPRKIEISPFDMKEECSSSRYSANTETGYTGLFTPCGLESSVDNNVPETNHKSSNLSALIHEVDSTVSTEVDPMPDVRDSPQLSISAKKQVELPGEIDSLEQSENDASAKSDSTIPASKGMSKIVFPEYILCYAIKHKLLYTRSHPYCKENVKMLRIIFSGFSKSPSHKFIYFYRKHLQDSDKDETVVQDKLLCENKDASSSCINEISSTSQKSKPLPDSPTTPKPTKMNLEVVSYQSSSEFAISQKPVSNLIQTSDSYPKLPTLNNTSTTNPLSNIKTLKLPVPPSISNCSTTDCDVSKSQIPMSTLPSDQTALKSTVPMSSSSVNTPVLPTPEISNTTPKPTDQYPQLEIIAFSTNSVVSPNFEIPKVPSKATNVECPQLPMSLPPGLPGLVKARRIPKTVYSRPTIVPNPQVSKYSSKPTTPLDPQDLSSHKPNATILENPVAAYSPIATTVPSTRTTKVVPSFTSNSKSSSIPRSVHFKPTPSTSSSVINDISDPQLPIDLSIEPNTISSPQNSVLSKPNAVAKSQMPDNVSNQTLARNAQNSNSLFSSESNLLQMYLITNMDPPKSTHVSNTQFPLDVSSKFAALFNTPMLIEATSKPNFFSNSQLAKSSAVPTSQMPMTTSQGSKTRTPRKPNTVTNHQKSKSMSFKPNTASNHQMSGEISFPTAISTFKVPIVSPYKQSHAPQTEIPIPTSFKQNLPPYPQVQIPALKKRTVSNPKPATKRSADSNCHLMFTPKSSATYPSSVKSHPSQHSVICHTSTSQSGVLPQTVPRSAFTYQPPTMSNISGGYQVPFSPSSLPHTPRVPVTSHMEANRQVPCVMNNNTHVGLPTHPIPPPVPYYNVNESSIHPSIGDDDLRKKVEETIKTLENEIVPDRQKLNALPLKKRKQSDENQTDLRVNVRKPTTTLLDRYPSTLMFSIAECVAGLERRRTSATRLHLNPAQILAEITSRHVMARHSVLAASSAPSPNVGPAMREPIHSHSAAPTTSQISGTYQANLVPIPRLPFEIHDSSGSQLQIDLQDRRPEHTASVNRTGIWRPIDLSIETAPISSKKMNK